MFTSSRELEFLSKNDIGEGAYSKVYHVRHKKTKTEYALKHVKLTRSIYLKFAKRTAKIYGQK
jgi:serine/threonine protein kinase